MDRLTQRQALEQTRLASLRSATAVHLQMKKRVGTLATIASTAPLIGLYGTVKGIPTAFIGCGGEKSSCVAAMVERLSGAIWPTALGLGVALVALCFYKFLLAQIEKFDLEMESAALCLVNVVSRTLPSPTNGSESKV